VRKMGLDKAAEVMPFFKGNELKQLAGPAAEKFPAKSISRAVEDQLQWIFEHPGGTQEEFRQVFVDAVNSGKYAL